jgi:hypothetical protein
VHAGHAAAVVAAQLLAKLQLARTSTCASCRSRRATAALRAAASRARKRFSGKPASWMWAAVSNVTRVPEAKVTRDFPR